MFITPKTIKKHDYKTINKLIIIITITNFCIGLCFDYLQCIYVFAVHFFIWLLRVFAARFCIWLCCEFLQHISLFGGVASICSMFLYLVLRVFAACFCVWLCMCCEYLQHVYVFAALSVLGCVASS